jgi:hypothetical protein
MMCNLLKVKLYARNIVLKKLNVVQFLHLTNVNCLFDTI